MQSYTNIMFPMLSPQVILLFSLLVVRVCSIPVLEENKKYDAELLEFNDCQNLCEHCLFCCARIYDSRVCSYDDYIAPLVHGMPANLGFDSLVSSCGDYCLRTLTPMCACKAHYDRI